MARSVEQIVKEQLGAFVLQISAMQAQLEELAEKLPKPKKKAEKDAK